MSIEAVPGGVRIHLHLQPGASNSGVTGLHGDRIRLRIAAPPVDGRANTALIEWLAEHLDVPRRDVVLVRGEKSRQKTVEVQGISVAQARERLGSSAL